MECTKPICAAMEKYNANTVRRFHMPGHGGKIRDGFLSEVSAFDVTELPETDNLAAPEGAIKESEEIAAEKFKSAATLFSCGGATLCIQAAIYAALKLKPHGRVFCHRRVHKSVINAFTLLDVTPKWTTDFEGDFSACDILVFTWADYYGNIAPYEKIEAIARKYGVLTVADNAHGSHLAFTDDGIFHPTRHGIDFCVDSLHKTLPVLTGGACLNLSNAAWYGLCREGMTLFGSTSPNYLIMASIEGALAGVSGKDFERTRHAVENLEKKFPNFFRHACDERHRDPLRILLRCENPRELYEYLYEKGIKCEFWDKSGVILIPPYGADEKYFEPLEAALAKYDCGNAEAFEEAEYKIPIRKKSMREAMFMPRETVDISVAEGKISAREYSLYPPGIPIIVAGEVFDSQIISCLKDGFNKIQIIKE